MFARDKNMHNSLDEFEIQPNQTRGLRVTFPSLLENVHRRKLGKYGVFVPYICHSRYAL